MKMLVCFPWVSASSEGGMEAGGFTGSRSFLEEALERLLWPTVRGFVGRERLLCLVAL